MLNPHEPHNTFHQQQKMTTMVTRAPPGLPAKVASVPPNQTLYVTNLQSAKIQKEDLRTALYMLFSTYGAVLDVVALKTMKMRGQAHIVYKDVQTATQAMRSLDGFEFFGRPMVRITFSRLRIAQWLTRRRKSRTQGPSPTSSPSSTAPSRCPQPPPPPASR
jgi:RNA recognition motif-containing protein